ncbi:MAG TPA: class I SAM-dependent methyltransferase [Acidobacteriaceae bacterium]|jgi:SAM-dependent methyltransferase|nr:class I SAM-dependent methyltransferase [Acidobacteriaceae bacterium]
MSSQVDLYDNAYARVENVLYRTIRSETYGQDLGQTSWVTSAESDLIPVLLNLTTDSSVLEIGCGSGGYAIFVAERHGSRVHGLDANPHAIASAHQLSAASPVHALLRFDQCDVSEPLPFADATFDAAFANDVLCHIPDRPRLLKELFRILRPGARLLFSDALIIGGVISHLELSTRSSIGRYFFSPPGENERLLASAGFALLSVSDTSEQAAAIAERWHDARERRRDPLTALEGPVRYAGLQRFLACVHELTSERRLLRILYVAQKPAPADPQS